MKDLNNLQLYLREVQKIPTLNADEQLSLARRAKADDEARNKLIEANLWLPVYVVLKEYRVYNSLALDLIQEGNLGLMKAVDGFDPDKGCRFSTYAVRWIRQAVSRAFYTQGHTIELPTYFSCDMAKVNRAASELEQELERTPTPEDLAEKLGIPAKQCLKFFQARAIKNSASLDAELPGTTDTFGSFAVDTFAPDLDDVAGYSVLKDALCSAMDCLNETERNVITMRYGLYDDNPRSLQAISEALGVSSSAIKLTEESALQKIIGG